MTYLRFFLAPGEEPKDILNEAGQTLVSEVVTLEGGGREVRVPLPAKVRRDVYVCSVPLEGTAKVKVEASSAAEAHRLVEGWAAFRNEYFMQAVAKALITPRVTWTELEDEPTADPVDQPPSVEASALTPSVCPGCSGSGYTVYRGHTEFDPDFTLPCDHCHGVGTARSE